MVGRPTQTCEKVRESHPVVWEGSEAHQEVQKGSGDPPKGPGRVGRPSRMSGKVWESHPEVREGSGGPLIGS